MINALALLFDRLANFVDSLTAHRQQSRLKEFTRSKDSTKMVFKDVDENQPKELKGSINLIEPENHKDGEI
jgi:hypothetical protein